MESKDRADLIAEALRDLFDQDYDWYDYLDAGLPLGPEGVEVWLEHEEGTTVN